MIQALSCSTFWELVLSEALRNHQRSGGAANVHSSFKLCHCVATHPLQWRGVSHRRLQKSTCPHSHINIFFSFDAPIPDIGPGRGKGAFRVCGIKLCQMFTVKLLRMRWVSCVTFSEFARQCRSSEAPVLSHPVETDPLGVQRMSADP